jgi:hypothetical protein
LPSTDRHVIRKVHRYSFADAELRSVLKMHVDVRLAAVPGVADVTNNVACAHMLPRSHSNRARLEMKDEQVLAGTDLENDSISPSSSPIGAARRRIRFAVVNIDDAACRGRVDGTIVGVIISQRCPGAVMGDAVNGDEQVVSPALLGIDNVVIHPRIRSAPSDCHRAVERQSEVDTARLVVV